MTHEMALEGLTVLDLSRVLAGPWCTQTLADLGAEVIKVEKPGQGDDTRGWGPPFLEGTTDAAYFTCCNRNKHSVAIDFSTKEGSELVRKLAKNADILVENYKLGGLKKYGLDYASLAKENPALIYCSITGFGQTGPYAHRAGYDFLVQGMSGMMSVTGAPDHLEGGGPVKAGVAISDLFTGLYATTSILAAVQYRHKTGKGQHIDCALLDCQVALMANQAANYLVGGMVPGRFGNNHPNVVPYRVYQVSDGYIIIACGNDGQFQRLCEALNIPELHGDARFLTNALRIINRDELDPLIENATRKFTKDEALSKLEQHQVPGGPINDLPDVFADPHIQARSMQQTLTRPDGTDVTVASFPVKLSETPAAHRSAPPQLGNATFDVLRDKLGLTPEDLKELAEGGLIQG